MMQTIPKWSQGRCKRTVSHPHPGLKAWNVYWPLKLSKCHVKYICWLRLFFYVVSLRGRNICHHHWTVKFLWGVCLSVKTETITCSEEGRQILWLANYEKFSSFACIEKNKKISNNNFCKILHSYSLQVCLNEKYYCISCGHEHFRLSDCAICFSLWIKVLVSNLFTCLLSGKNVPQLLHL